MSKILFVLILFMAGATLFVLAKGVIGMAQGRDLTGQRSQALMRKRVLYQGIAIVLIILFLLVASGGRH
ncbi:MAG: HIG1 domain-containing protein [Allosphingosinicella sp.]